MTGRRLLPAAKPHPLHGLATPTGASGRLSSKRKVTDEMARAFAARVSAGADTGELAAEFGLHRCTVNAWVAHLPGRRLHRRKPVCDYGVLADYARQHGSAKAAGRFGVSLRTVSRARRAYLEGRL